MKKFGWIALVCLLLSLSMLTSCGLIDQEPPDLTDYYEVGHVWHFEYYEGDRDLFYYAFSFSIELLDIAKDHVTLRVFDIDFINETGYNLEERVFLTIFSKLSSRRRGGYSKAVIDGIEYYTDSCKAGFIITDTSFYELDIPLVKYAGSEFTMDLYYNEDREYNGLAKIEYMPYDNHPHLLFIYLY